MTYPDNFHQAVHCFDQVWGEWSEMEPVCGKTWLTIEEGARRSCRLREEDEFINHHCYLQERHSGKCVCGYCEEGFDHV